MKKLYLILLLVCAGIITYAQPQISLSKVYGGDNRDENPHVATMPNGDFIVAAYSQSTNFNHTNNGQADIYVLRLKTNGDTVWTKLIGGAGYDLSQDVIVNSLGQIVILGYTSVNSSNTGDIGPVSGSSDFLFLRLDANDGTILKSKNFGSTSDDNGTGILEISNNRYLAYGIVGGATGNVTGPLKGGYDSWLAVLDSNGNVLKDKNFGGSSNDEIFDLTLASDGYYYFTGASRSNDQDLSSNYGSQDGWVAKVDTALNLIWSRNIGGSDYDEFYIIKEFDKGSLIVGGSTQSNDNDYINVQNTDVDEGNISLTRIDTAGNIIWINCYGGTEQDDAGDIIIRNNNILHAGTSLSNDIDVSNNYGNSYDVWLVELDGNGSILWEKNYGGTLNDEATQIYGDDTGNVYIFGHTRSNDIDLSTNNGIVDLWLFKLCMPADTSITKNNYTYTNTHNYPGATYQWVDCNNNYSAIVGATNKTYTATKNGDYALIINTGCRQDTTDCFNVNGITNSISQVELGNGIALYPNPSNGVFTIQYDQGLGDISINVITITGKQVMYQTLQKQQNKMVVQLHNVPDGFYMINIKQGVRTHNFKLLKN